MNPEGAVIFGMMRDAMSREIRCPGCPRGGCGGAWYDACCAALQAARLNGEHHRALSRSKVCAKWAALCVVTRCGSFSTCLSLDAFTPLPCTVTGASTVSEAAHAS